MPAGGLRRRSGVAAEIDQRVDALEHAVGGGQQLAEVREQHLVPASAASSTSISP